MVNKNVSLSKLRMGDIIISYAEGKKHWRKTTHNKEERWVNWRSKMRCKRMCTDDWINWSEALRTVLATKYMGIKYVLLWYYLISSISFSILVSPTSLHNLPLYSFFFPTMYLLKLILVAPFLFFSYLWVYI